MYTIGLVTGVPLLFAEVRMTDVYVCVGCGIDYSHAQVLALPKREAEGTSLSKPACGGCNGTEFVVRGESRNAHDSNYNVGEGNNAVVDQEQPSNDVAALKPALASEATNKFVLWRTDPRFASGRKGVDGPESVFDETDEIQTRTDPDAELVLEHDR